MCPIISFKCRCVVTILTIVVCNIWLCFGRTESQGKKIIYLIVICVQIIML